ncbi:MAG: periplasmic heavy metal sensor, partial [Pseudomonas sp.]|nr:periplasmic heavy metal sensor [Pseudomonas sp.]
MNKTWLIAGALLLSLAGNAFLAGWLLGRPANHGAQIDRDSGTPRMQQLLARVKHLPDEQRRALSAKVHGYAPQLHELGQANQQLRQNVQQLLLAPQLDRNELERAFASQRQLQERMQALSQRMLLDIAEQLPAEQRAKLLQRDNHTSHDNRSNKPAR